MAAKAVLCSHFLNCMTTSSQRYDQDTPWGRRIRVGWCPPPLFEKIIWRSSPQRLVPLKHVHRAKIPKGFAKQRHEKMIWLANLRHSRIWLSWECDWRQVWNKLIKHKTRLTNTQMVSRTWAIWKPYSYVKSSSSLGGERRLRGGGLERSMTCLVIFSPKYVSIENFEYLAQIYTHLQLIHSIWSCVITYPYEHGSDGSYHQCRYTNDSHQLEGGI